MGDSTNNRKMEHIRIIQNDPESDRNKHYFDRIRLTHRALPETSLDAVDPSTIFLGYQLSFPMIISSMTGGKHELTKTINENLALAAQTTGVAMAVGSQRVMFRHSEAEDSFRLRDCAPDVPLCGNLGAVQLNCDFGLDECRRAVEMLDADALCLHLNPLQEAVQPEGNTDFSRLADKIGEIAVALGKPLIVKEVGAGISLADARLLATRGVRIIDVAGSGGTSWSRIEQQRCKDDDELGILFQDWGIPTPLALEQLRPMAHEVDIIASGGIRNGIDMAKAVILGARLCGVAGPLLEPAIESAEAVIDAIERLQREFTTAMFLLGCKSVDELRDNQSLIMTGGDLWY